jgi:hypothetical protein
MKYRRSESFRADYQRLTLEERALFRVAVRQINEAYERRGADGLPQWPAVLRIKPLRGASGIWEMT